MGHLTKVLTPLKEANLSLKLKKCEFARKEDEYLTHIFRPEQLEMSETKVEAVRAMVVPERKAEIQTFLGMTRTRMARRKTSDKD